MPPTEAQFKALQEFGVYRGVIERVQIRQVWNVEKGADGEIVYVIGRRNASKIVKALHDAGFKIVPAALGE